MNPNQYFAIQNVKTVLGIYLGFNKQGQLIDIKLSYLACY